MTKTIVAAVAALCVAAPVAGLAQQPATAPAVAQAGGQDALAQCLIENHDAAIEAPMKAFLIAALQEQKAAAQTNAMGFGMAIAQAAMTKCGADMAAMQTPAFQGSVEAYGAWVGEKIMTDAMGKLGLM